MRYTFDVPKFLDWVVQTWTPVAAAADQAAYSRSHFTRLVAEGIGETPRALRHRLQMEAGAHLLLKTAFNVGEVAMEVGYATPEAFTKAFQRSFGRSPKEFRRAAPSSIWLGSETGVHFHPSGVIVRRQGASRMKLNDILFRHHVDELTSLLKLAATMPDGELDAETVALTDAIPWEPHKPTLRGLLKHLVMAQEIWLAAFKGEAYAWPSEDPSIAELDQRHAVSGPALLDFVNEVEAKDMWESEFVDALCEEPVRFVFGAVLAHILVFGAHRRQLAFAALRRLGRTEFGYGDPINWLRSVSGEVTYNPPVCS